MVFLFSDLLERRFPEQFSFFLTEVTFNALYLYSKLQIYFARANKRLNEYIDANPTLLKIKSEFVTFIKPRGGFVYMTQFIKDGKPITLCDSGITIDFAIYSWLSDNKRCVNKKIIYDINEPIIRSDYSDVKFMLIEIKAGDKTYKIDFKTDDYNFYLVGNKFTKQFFVYYLVKYLNINENDLRKTGFSVKIIDHNVESFQMNFTDKNESIVLHKNVYLHRIK
jgi:hypothetical protein